MTEENKEENIFRKVEERLLQGEDVTEVLGDLDEGLKSDEFQEKAEQAAENMVQDPLEEREQIFNLEDNIMDIFTEALEAMGSSEEELKEYFQEKDADAQASAADLLMSWDYCLMMVQMIGEEKTTEEYIELSESLFQEAEEQDKDRLNEVLAGEVEYQKMLQGFEYAFYSAAAQDKPQEILLKEKMDGIHQLYEGMMKPLFLFISGLVATGEDDERNPEGLGTAKQVIGDSSYEMDKFWVEDARIIRNGLSHTDFSIDEDGLTIYTKKGDVYEYSTKEVDQVFGRVAKKARELFVALAIAHREEHLPEEDQTDLSDIRKMAQEEPENP